MTYELANDSIAMRLAKCLYRRADVTDAPALLGICYSLIKGFLRDFKQLGNLVRDFAYTKCIARISIETIQKHSAVH